MALCDPAPACGATGSRRCAARCRFDGARERSHRDDQWSERDDIARVQIASENLVVPLRSEIYPCVSSFDLIVLIY